MRKLGFIIGLAALLSPICVLAQMQAVLSNSPPSSAGSSQVLASVSPAVLSGTGNRFFPVSFTPQNASTTDLLSAPFPVAGTISLLRVNAVTPPTGAAIFAVTINKNGSGSALTCNVTSTVNPCSDTNNAHSFSVAAGDYIDVESTPTGSPSNSFLSASVVFTPTNSGDTFIPSRFIALSTASAQDEMLFDDRLTVSQRSFFNEAGTIDNLYINTSAPGGVASYAFSVFKNGAASGSPGNLTATVTGSATTANDTADSISVSSGDAIQFHSVPSGTPSAATGGFSLRWRPTTAGNFAMMAASTFNDSNASTVYIPITGSPASQITTEATAQTVSNSMTVNSIQFRISVAPGTGKSRTFSLNANGSSLLSCAITDAATACTATGPASVNDNDLLDISDVPSGTPAVALPNATISAHR